MNSQFNRVNLRYIALLLFILWTNHGELRANDSLENTIDSIRQLINAEPVDTARYALLRTLCSEVTKVDRARSIPIFRERLALAEKINDDVKIAGTAQSLGSQFLYLGNTDSAFVYLTMANELFTELEDLWSINENLNNLALIYQRTNRYEEAVETYQQVIVYSDSLEDYVGSVYTYINLMSLFMDLDDEPKALEYADKIEEVKGRFAQLNDKDVEEIQGLFSAVYLNVGLCHTALNNLDTADYYFKVAYESLEYVANEYANTYYKGYIDNSLGDNYFERADLNAGEFNENNYLSQALTFYTEAHKSFSDISESRGITFSLNNIGKTLNKIGDYLKAKEKLLSALELALSIDFQEQVRDSYEYLADNSEHLGDYKNSNQYLRQWIVHRDSIRNVERDEAVNILEVKFQTAEQEKEIAQLALENERKTRQQTRQRYIYWISILVFLGIAYAVYERLRYSKQKEKMKYEQDMNQAMSRFVPMGFIKALGKNKITDVQLGDQIETNVTVVFTDIRSFTTISEGMTPNENFAFVKEYAERMGPIIERNGGFISQYLGDGIMAIFKNSPGAALDSCVAMQQDIRAYNDLLVAKGSKPIKVGMGMHTGPLVMGIIGDEMRWDATLISDTVNTASRIEKTTKDFQSPILLSEDSVKGIPNVDPYKLKHMGEVRVKGKTKAVRIYECDDALVHM